MNCRYPLSLRLSLAVACGSLVSSIAQAQSAAPTPAEKTLKTVEVTTPVNKDADNPYASEKSPYKVEELSSFKQVRPIEQLPKSITVLSKESLRDAGASNLKEALKQQPGITIGTGEGGNAFGDRFIIRGFEARNDVFIDGLRDPGVNTRDTFALEQIEISKGPSATFAGRGTTGGAVNSVTKKPQQDNFTKLETTIGSNNRKSQTIDANYQLSNDIAVRGNFLASERDIAGRDGVDEKRKGAALAATWRATDALKLNADFYFQHGNDTPDGGVPWDALAQKPVPDRNFYGQLNRDYQRTDSKIGTIGAEYNFNKKLKINSQTRYGVTQNEYVVSVPSLASNLVRAGTPIGVNTPGVFVRANSQTRNQENTYLANQTNMRYDTAIGNMPHSFIIGTELSKERATNLPFSDSARSANAGNPFSPNNYAWTGRLTPNPAGYARLNINSAALYAMDTWTINKEWEVSGGLRYDMFKYDIISGATAYTGNTNGVLKNDVNALNGHAGVTYSPFKNGKFYSSYSTSSNVTGEQIDSFTNCNYGGLCVDGKNQFPKPERSQNIEIGTKWNVFDDRMLLTGALFQTTKDNVVARSGTGSAVAFNQAGQLKVQGLELGASGNVTDALSLQGGISLLKTEVTKSVNPAAVGKRFPNTAEKSASLQARYQATNDWAVGSTVTYVGSISGGQPNGAATVAKIAPHARLDLMTEYAITDTTKLRLNILNVTDKKYYDALYQSAAPFVYVGEGRTAFLTLAYEL